nr:unnamed protein product [Spirometra erinaceieuropaei]
MLNLRWQHWTPDTDVLEWTGISSAPTSQRKGSIVPDLPTLPADTPSTDRPFGHLRTNFKVLTTPAAVSPNSSASSTTPTINTDRTPEPPLTSSSLSSSIASKSATAAPVPTITTHNSDTLTNIQPTHQQFH